MNTKKNIKHNKIELSLSAMMFFAPLVQHTINKDKGISEQDKSFIKGYINLGYFNIVLLIINIATQIRFYLAQNTILQQIGFIFSIILGISLVVGTIFILKNKEFLKSPNYKEKVTFDINNMVYYIPIYNIYIWYKKHNFDKPNPILKESIILWIVFVLLLFIFKGISIIIVIFAIIIIRIIYLLQGGYNIYNKSNKLFRKNPEEIWAYPKGLITSLFNKKTISESIRTNKLKFELIPKISDKQIIIQYIILSIVLFFLVYVGIVNDNINLLIGTILMFTRYIIMFIIRKHTPNIPIIKEITNLFFKNKNEN